MGHGVLGTASLVSDDPLVGETSSGSGDMIAGFVFSALWRQ